MEVWIGGLRVALDSARSIGKGGEADVYDLGDGRALKLYKTSSHPDLAGAPEEQRAAEERIAVAQKKLACYPLPLPDRVVQPIDLAADRRGRILGYTMPLIAGADPLRRYSERAFRDRGVDANRVVRIFRDLHSTVVAVHRASVAIGDFNDLNVLVRDTAAYLIDADSFQFGPYPCRVFTQRFVDPLLCRASADGGLMLVRPHNPLSDWYALAVMLFTCLLYVDPYGGVYRPANSVRQLPHDQRPLKRVTVFDPEVRYPRPAVPYGVLPDELLDYFQRVFVGDERGEMPAALLDNLRWTRCSNCGAEHARSSCPSCALVAPAAVVAATTVRGKVTATRIFRTRGRIAFAAMQGDRLRWLYHEDGALRREGGREVIRGDVAPDMRFRIWGDATLVGQAGRLVTLRPGESPQSFAVDSVGKLPIFDAGEGGRFWLSGGSLWTDREVAGQRIPEAVGQVLAGQTHLWVGPAFGFGFYRAGSLSAGFVFGTKKRGINDTVKLPRLGGELVDSTCVFTRDRCYFLLATREAGRIVHRCLLILPDGSVEALAEATEGDGSWLGTLRGRGAAGRFLLAPTDDGVVRVEPAAGSLAATRLFPDTEPFVDASSHLFPGPDGLYVVGRKEIALLRIAP